MKKMTTGFVSVLLSIWLLVCSADAAQLLIPGGQIIGLELKDRSVRVAAFEETLGKEAHKAGLQVGDQLLKINDKPIQCAEDVKKALALSDGYVTLHLQRDGKEKQIRFSPQVTSEGPRLGVYLKEGITGIGTLTWYDPDSGTFGALGHGVNTPQGELAPLTEGHSYRCSVISVKKGKAGDPGQLFGTLTGSSATGDLTKNTSNGIFGTSKTSWSGQELPVASASEIKKGPATIRSTVQGTTVQEYSVEILKIYPTAGNTGRNLLLRITDPALLTTTGGIVQGMSGSPIIQDGKLVGAVTHVLVNDPTTGYGIFIENMLDAAA